MEQHRFCQLWNRVGGRAANKVFTDLAAHYAEPHRHYHTAAHIKDCLTRLDLAANYIEHIDAVELAIWFHDVIYQCGKSDNEKLSADWFSAQAAGLDKKLISQVHRYIVSTMHTEPPPDAAAKWVVDIDLSGMGMSAESFNRDGDNIRREFSHLSDTEFVRGQTAFLQKLLARKHIYYTKFLCETQARDNITKLLTRTKKFL